MTTDNATELRAGSLVLYAGDVRVVEDVARFSDAVLLEGDLGTVRRPEVTPIGHPEDGWRVHSTSERPVGADDRVEVWNRSGPSPASGLLARNILWEGIVAYRLAPNPEKGTETKPGLNKLVEQAQAWFEALSPAEKDEHLRKQRECYVRSELAWGDEGTRIGKPNPTHQEAEAREEGEPRDPEWTVKTAMERAETVDKGTLEDQAARASWDFIRRYEPGLEHVRTSPDPQPIAPSDLRTIAEEMRNWWIGFNEIAHVPRRQLNEWANLLSRELEPLKPGDRVIGVWCSSAVWKLISIHGEWAFVELPDCADPPTVVRLSELQPITPEKA